MEYVADFVERCLTGDADLEMRNQEEMRRMTAIPFDKVCENVACGRKMDALVPITFVIRRPFCSKGGIRQPWTLTDTVKNVCLSCAEEFTKRKRCCGECWVLESESRASECGGGGVETDKTVDST